jgi:hypothetical protein
MASELVAHPLDEVGDDLRCAVLRATFVARVP